MSVLGCVWGVRRMCKAVGEQNDALEHARAIQIEAAAVGFDWPNITGVLAKVREEIGEIESACISGNDAHARKELGDLLFSAVNLARFLETNPSEELRRTNRRFSERFGRVQEEVRRNGRTMQECTLAELDEVWESVKDQDSG